MIKSIKKHVKTAMICTLAATLALPFSMSAAAEQVQKQSASYRTITEVADWGAVITKVIVDLGKPVPKNSVTTDTFKVHVVRNDKRLSDPFIEEGDRKVTKAYVADKNGKPASKTGRYAVLEMEIGPTVSLGSAINYDMDGTGYNDWNENKYTITQQKGIETSDGIISGLVVDTFAGGSRVLVDQFTTGKATNDDITLTYANFTPAKDNKKNPLIIWLHGMGEGGTDPTIPISGNKAVNFASKDIQSYFGGAYVLAPQTPTFWMDGFTGFGDGTSKYERSLMTLIKNYVSQNKDIDLNRIYIGGDSNGGYMTMLLIRDNPKYFAAAFPTCEPLKDELISDADIQKMKKMPIWFTAAKTDPVVPPNDYVVPTYNRLIKAGAKNVQLSLFDNVHDTSGLYKNEDDTPYEYNGHWSWIYVYNNECTAKIKGKTTTIMEWLAGQSLKK
ncbi:prolyl oligopeptidase family serine peptidase [Brevibacillus ginsengisoli]|uniref:prolyl oligopeptidase family serine peptidase n=1 Tax=Brevibacillus ginsengisoli TaxID=363854 RepID=UPI003CF05909